MAADSTIITYLGVGLAASRPASPNTGSGVLAFYYASDTLTLSAWDGSSWHTVVGGGGATDFILVQDQKSANTAGGTFTSGADRTRDLNTEVVDTGGFASVSSNQIHLDAGTYRALIFVPAYSVDTHQSWLYNVTDSVIVLKGLPAYASAAGTVMNFSVIQGRFTISGTKVLEVRHRCVTTKSGDGFGVPGNTTPALEIYTSVELTKEA